MNIKIDNKRLIIALVVVGFCQNYGSLLHAKPKDDIRKTEIINGIRSAQESVFGEDEDIFADPQVKRTNFSWSAMTIAVKNYVKDNLKNAVGFKDSDIIASLTKLLKIENDLTADFTRVRMLLFQQKYNDADTI